MDCVFSEAGEIRREYRILIQKLEFSNRVGDVGMDERKISDRAFINFDI
jgi:hypothetical protein